VDRLSLEASGTKPLDFFSLVVWLVLNHLRRPARALDRPLKPQAEIILVRTRGPNSAHVGSDPKSGLLVDVAGRQRCAKKRHFAPQKNWRTFVGIDFAEDRGFLFAMKKVEIPRSRPQKGRGRPSMNFCVQPNVHRNVRRIRRRRRRCGVGRPGCVYSLADAQCGIRGATFTDAIQ
jgi:hypothetical protein